MRHFIFLNIIALTLFCLFAGSAASAASKNTDKQGSPAQAKKSTEDILRYADKTRGGGLPGIEWRVEVESEVRNGKVESFVLKVSAATDAWVAEFVEPRNVFGNKLLKSGEKMWFTKQGLRRAVPISQRQRLTGGAANGDIASTNYVRDYDAVQLDDELIDGKDNFVFALTSKTSSVTYDKIKYWVDKTTGLGKMAEFYTSEGKLLKSAKFEYDNIIEHEGIEYPFISSMTIHDIINKKRQSSLNYSNIEVKSISAAKFKR